MATTTITFEIDEKHKQQFAEVARARHCSAEELVEAEFAALRTETERKLRGEKS